MELQYFGRKQLLRALMRGWSPVEGHEYALGEYLFILVREDLERPAEAAAAIVKTIAVAIRTGKSTRKAAVRISPDRKDKVIRRLKNGYSHNAISKELGIARRTVSKIRAEAAIW